MQLLQQAHSGNTSPGYKCVSKFLVIVLCRMIAEGNSNNINNVNTVVEFLLENLYLSTISNLHEQSAVNLSYNLIGTVNHKAKRNGGHYTAITKKADHWHCYNDKKSLKAISGAGKKTGH